MNGLNKMCNTLEEYSVAEMSKGKNAINTKEFGEVVDMMKDLSEVKNNNAEACYYQAITEAMENAEYGEDYDYRGRMGYQPQMMGRNNYSNVMPGRRGYDDGRMYYSGRGNGMPNSQGGRSGSRYGYSHDEYMEAKQMYSGLDPDSKKMRMESLNDYLEDLTDSAKELVSGMSPDEKQRWKSTLSNIINL